MKSLLTVCVLAFAVLAAASPVPPVFPNKWICRGEAFELDAKSNIVAQGSFINQYDWNLRASRQDVMYVPTSTGNSTNQIYWTSSTGTSLAIFNNGDNFFDCYFFSGYSTLSPNYISTSCNFQGNDILEDGPAYLWKCDLYNSAVDQYVWTNIASGSISKLEYYYIDSQTTDIYDYDDCRQVSSFPDVSIFTPPSSLSC